MLKPMTWEQRTLLLDAAMHEPALGSVLRDAREGWSASGEAFALRPDDIDFREISVEHAASYGRIKATKTYERRTVDLSPEPASGLRHPTR